MADDMPARIREILLHHWDPAGVADVPVARDEYDAYVDILARMIVSRRSISEISTELLTIETEKMGLPGNSDRAVTAARKLFKLGFDRDR